jgi:tetratricopeptide (TPR) repeat protein
MNNMALRFWELDDLDAARSAAQSAVERAREAGSLDTEALAHGTLAQVYLKTDNIQQARAEAESAAEMAQGETSIARIDAWRVLARLAEDEGDHERADELYVKTLDVLESSDQRFRYADVAVAYSKALRERGDTDRAFDLALKAAQIKSARTP